MQMIAGAIVLVAAAILAGAAAITDGMSTHLDWSPALLFASVLVGFIGITLLLMGVWIGPGKTKE